MSFLDAERFIEEAIESVFAQTYSEWELLLVDDGSTDTSQQIAQRCASKHPARVSYVQHPGRQNLGQAASRNCALRHARGKYVAILDSDDVWLPTKLREQVGLLELHDNLTMVFGSPYYWRSAVHTRASKARQFTPQIDCARDIVYPPPEMLLLTLSGRVTAPCPSDVIFRRQPVLALGGFEDAFSGLYGMYEDQAFLAKIFLLEPVYFASNCWTKYRLHADSFSAIQTQAGRERSIRLFYLQWLEAYLRREGVTDHRIWRLVRRHTLSYRLQASMPAVMSRLFEAALRVRNALPGF